MKYHTDLTDSEWEVIKEYLPLQRKRKHSLRSIVDAILYMTKSGVQWRLLPHDFPKWQLVYYYFSKWSATGLTELLHDKLVGRVRKKEGREESPSLGLLDSQSVKTASVTTEKGFDGAKNINGRKRFIVTDTLGLVLALVITTANTGERAGAKLLLQELRGKYHRLTKILVDQGFSGQEFLQSIQSTFGWILEVVAKVAGIAGFHVLPKRWIVERTFGWFMFNRRLVKDYEVKIDHSASFIHWAMIRNMSRKLQ